VRVERPLKSQPHSFIVHLAMGHHDAAKGRRIPGTIAPIALTALLCGVLLGAASAAAQQSSSLAPVQTPSPELMPVRAEFNVMIAMRDGVKLAADILRPDRPGKFPVILARTPYGKYSQNSYQQAQYFAQRGYVYVNQDVRGRFDSEGEFEVLVNEARDGYDTIEWLAAQPWSDGNVGTFGGSYMAWDQFLAAEEQPPHLRTMVVQSTPPDIFLTAWWHGAFFMNELFWCALMDGRVNQELSMYADPQIPLSLPVINMDQKLGRRLDETFRAWIEHDTYDDFWRRQSYQSNLSRVRVPVLHVDGWYDLHDVSATLANYNALSSGAASPEARRNQRVVIGPWWHGNYEQRKVGAIDFGTEAAIDRKSLYLKWYNCHLENRNCDDIAKQPPVRIFLLGANQWSDETNWPPERAVMTSFYLSSRGHANSRNGDGVLTTQPPASDPADHYAYNPQDPPTIATEPDDNLAADQQKPESRKDVLVFSSPPLKAPLQITGHLTVKLWASSSARDTDWVVRLVDVHPDGLAQRLTDSIVRAAYQSSSSYPQSKSEFTPLTPGSIREYTLDLDDLANVFLPGHRIRLEITSAFMPLFARNLNTGQNSLTTHEMKVAEQTIYHDRQHPSRILLPVIAQ
jgi:putative CocE/NonD family hydrolase